MNINNNTRREYCPVCQSREVTSIGPLDYGRNVKFGSVNINPGSTPELWECRTCESWFVNNILAEKDALELYTVGESNQRWSAQPFAEAKSPEILHTLNEMFLSRPRVIDIGCNTGELLDYCAAQGAVTYGVELSSSSRSVCQAKGHSVFESIAAVTGSFDIAFAFDLIEHVYDIHSLLKSICQMLQKGGRLVILTGDNSSVTARLYRQNWWYARYPEHIVFPSWKSWCGQEDFRAVRKVVTYASRGYRPKPLGRIKAFVNLLQAKGNGLPLISGDHHLMILEKL
jgi:SAM-dependent methyltransferase